MDRGVARLFNSMAQHQPWRFAALVSAKYLIAIPVLIVLGVSVQAVRRRDTRPLAYSTIAVVGTAIAFALDKVVGHVYFRLRPYWALSSAHAIGARSGESAFYSDLTAIAAGLAFGVFFVSHRWGWVALASAVLVAFGRVAIGAHYPTDVLGAGVVGVACVAALLPARHRVERLLGRLADRSGTEEPRPPLGHEHRWRRAAIVVLAIFVGWVAGRLQDHGVHAALSRAEGRIHGTIPADTRLYRSTDIETIASGRWHASRARVYGVVTYVTREPDGDVHVILKAPDHSFIVLEITPEIPMRAPHDDDRITAWGVVRHDGLHNWWELHPLTGWTYGRDNSPSAPGLDD